MLSMRLGIGGLSMKRPDSYAVIKQVQKAERASANHEVQDITHLMPSNHPWGWNADYDRVQVGKGKRAYTTAREFVKTWQHMGLGWVDTNRPEVKVGEHVIVMAKVLGLLWMCNPLRIVYAREEKASMPATALLKASRQPACTRKGMRYDFWQTTLEGHSLAGEERFSVQWCKEDDSVWYEIYAISRPATLLALTSYPLARYYQRRFRQESIAAVRDAVETS
ncbi:g2095 [Coccomyxa elongata]